MPTSGIPMPAACACLRTVSTSQSSAEIAALRRQPAIHAEQPRRDRQHEQDGEVGGEEQNDAFHDGLRW
jgi:hypothetical protein